MSSSALLRKDRPKWRALLDPRPLLILSPDQASFEVRGFQSDSVVSREALERIGRTFIAGYNAALGADRLEQIARFISEIPAQLRGFAAEGAAMGTAVSDALPFRTALFPEILALLDRDFTYLAHVGAGWALARVPWRKRQILKRLDPLHRWLAFDGLGFHDCYFYPRKVLNGWRRERGIYATRAYDQGVGRALWFVGGGSAVRGAREIWRLAGQRHGDLFSGLGLAMAYAGPATREDIQDLLELSGREHCHVAQGLAFACEARARAGHIPAHTHAAAHALGFEASALSALVRRSRESLSEGDGEPRYEAWRRRVSVEIVSMTEARA